MPANLTPEYLQAEKAFKEAQTSEEKLEALRHMMAVIPKHKGTEKMRADIKTRISKLTEAIQKSGKTGRRAMIDHVEREGCGQITILGAPNSGKSSVLAALTNANTEIAPYPFSTQHPIPGMMSYEDVQIQLIDTPPLAESMTPTWLSNTARNADGILLLVNLAEADILSQAEMLLNEIRKGKVEPVREDGEDERVGWFRRPTIIVGAQVDQAGALSRVRELRAWVGDRFPVVILSTATGEGLNSVRRELFQLLRLVRVYSKMPQKPPDLTKPFVVKQGDTVLDVARLVHKDFAENLTFAKIWGEGKYDGQRVKTDHAVHDGDVLELHLK
ncbi:MAG: 50S ribosome-binding GTPase [Candidatus Eisenbacteria sp.]|nr:50S ribosome-binding GTPase [Candidatus Eisenbacteria bacterium]